MKLKYETEVTDRTLRSWCNKLIGKDIVQKCGRETFWKTQRFGAEQHRTKVSADDPRMAQYFQKKREYFEVAMLAAEKAGKKGKEAVLDAWDTTFKSLWREFGCCYYSCRGLLFNAIEEDYIFEIYELAQEIAAALNQQGCNLLRWYAQNPMLQQMGLVTADGAVDLDALRDAARDNIPAGGLLVELPMGISLRINTTDVDSLYKAIREEASL